MGGGGAPANQNITTETKLPEFYQTYLQDLFARAQGAAGDPYQQYTGALNAAQTADQTGAYDIVRNVAGGSASPWLQAGTDLYNKSANTNTGAAGQGSFDSATGLFNQGANTDTSAMYQPFGQQATGLAYGAGAQAQPYIQQSVNPTGLAAASPYLNAASSSFPGSASAYMSPYISGVTDRIAQLGAQNLSENLLPALSDDFVRAGQYGSTRQRDLVGRALRDTQNSVLGQQAQALEQGYSTAGQLYNQDANRYAGLAGTAGGLGTQQQQILQGAGSQLGNLGLSQAGLISNIGSTGAGLSGADASRQIQAGQGISSIGQSQIQAAQADAARQLQAAQGLAGIGQLGQNMSLQAAQALEGAGAAQQAQTQQGYNTLYQQFLQQQQYPWTQIGNLSSVLQGLPGVGQSTTQQTQTTAAPPSPLAQVGGVGLGLAGLAGSGVFGKAKGGAVRSGDAKKKKSRASYGVAPSRGLHFMKAA